MYPHSDHHNHWKKWTLGSNLNWKQIVQLFERFLNNWKVINSSAFLGEATWGPCLLCRPLVNNEDHLGCPRYDYKIMWQNWSWKTTAVEKVAELWIEIIVDWHVGLRKDREIPVRTHTRCLVCLQGHSHGTVALCPSQTIDTDSAPLVSLGVAQLCFGCANLWLWI